jgi:SAM-dependent methyltransferase
MQREALPKTPEAQTGREHGEQSPQEHDHVRWFEEHYDQAAKQIIDFFESDGIDLSGKTVADIGCGDGIIDLGVFHKAKPAKLIGYDVREPDLTSLRRTAEALELKEPFPDPGRFQLAQSLEQSLPAENDSFDYAFTWSVFEHVSQPLQMLNEICRILKPSGALFVQVWPLYYSEHGGHLWMHYSESYSHLLHSDSEIESTVRLKPGTDPTRLADDEYRSLNRLTIDDLQRAMLGGGFAITKLELLTETVHLDPGLAMHPLSALGISGVKLLAVPRFK